MLYRWKLAVLLNILYHSFPYTYAATTSIGSPRTGMRSSRHLPRNNGYLPPYSTISTDDDTKMLQNIETFQTSPQINNGRSKYSNMRQYKSYTSYVPPASGAASLQYSMPHAVKSLPLPSLIPKSVVDQIGMPLTYQQESVISQPEVPMAALPVLMVEESPTMLLTTSQNKTLQAARILASSLLEANDESAVFDHKYKDMQEQSSGVNSTDFVVVKSQKHAYIIPTHLAKEARNPTIAREIYQMRDQLQKAFTINQFIFIIKPKKINFLNKLV